MTRATLTQTADGDWHVQYETTDTHGTVYSGGTVCGAHNIEGFVRHLHAEGFARLHRHGLVFVR